MIGDLELGLTSMRLAKIDADAPGLALGVRDVEVVWTWGWSSGPVVAEPRATVGSATLELTRGELSRLQAARAERSRAGAPSTDPSGGLRERLDLAGLTWAVENVGVNVDLEDLGGVSRVHTTLAGAGTLRRAELALRQVRTTALRRGRCVSDTSKATLDAYPVISR